MITVQRSLASGLSTDGVAYMDSVASSTMLGIDVRRAEVTIYQR
jgi:hypothetical protein